MVFVSWMRLDMSFGLDMFLSFFLFSFLYWFLLLASVLATLSRLRVRKSIN